MNIQIQTVSLGMVNCYLLRNNGYVLVDAGFPGSMRLFLRKLEQCGVHPKDIELVIITHGHMDHMGLAAGIKDLTGAKLAIHKCEREWLVKGVSPLPPGTTVMGKLLVFLGRRFPPMTTTPTDADILLDDEGMSLEKYGIPGKVIYTPGHTMGSISVLLDSGDALVGDLAASALFMRFTPGPPIFAEDLDLVMESWKKLLDLGVNRIFPAHGKPFSADVLRKLMA